MFGNPPWIKVSWNDAPLLAEFEPKLGVGDAKSATYNRERLKLLEAEHRRFEYRDAFEQGEGAGAFLNDRTLYPSLAGVQTNLYKNFIERSWGLLGGQGTAGLLHPEGVFDDPKGGVFRQAYYRRLLGHYQFKNEHFLFADIGNRVAFSINVYSGASRHVDIRMIFNLFNPSTIESCYAHQNLNDPIPGIKTENDQWGTRGHRKRILTITEHELNLFATLFEHGDTPSIQSRLPQVHSQPLLKVLEKFVAAQRRLGDIKAEYLPTVMFDETYAQRDGIITRQEDPSFQPQSADEWVVSGPHFYVGTPLNKTPFTKVISQRAYDDIDLAEIPDDYLPRAVYRPGDRNGDLSAFHAAIPEWPKPGKPVGEELAQKRKGAKEDEEQEEGDLGVLVSRRENTNGGFWPVSKAELSAYEALVGEPLHRFGIDPTKPGARTARQFGYFVEWTGDVEGAVRWLLANQCRRNSDAFYNRFSDVRLRQEVPNDEAMRRLPRPVTSYVRYMNRKRAQPANERTLIPAILPPGPTHIINAFSLTFVDQSDCLLVGSLFVSVCFDFFVKLTGSADVIGSVLRTLPLPDKYRIFLIRRTLRLTCLTSHYADLWQSTFNLSVREDAFTSPIPSSLGAFAPLRENSSSDDDSVSPCENNAVELPWSKLPPHWQRGCALRSDFARRQALLEIDVLVAMALNLTFDELKQIYEVQFPVMKAYEAADRYDATGRRLPNTTRKDAGAKEMRDALTSHDGKSPVTVSWPIDNGNQTVTKTFYPPFTPVDRIEDYQRAFRVFQERLGGSTAKATKSAKE